MSSGRPQKILRPTALNTVIPEDLRAKLDLHLFSSVENRIPHGAYSKFITELLQKFFEGGVTERNPNLALIDQHGLKALGLLTKIALTDLRTGWSADRITEVVREAREITGKVPVK